MAFLFASSSLLPAFRSLVWAFIGVGASFSVLSAIRFLVPPPAAYFPAKESRQSSPGCGPDPGLGGGGIGTGLANPLVATRRFSLRPQHFGHWPLGRISPLQNL